jgi:hypothetical protein
MSQFLTQVSQQPTLSTSPTSEWFPLAQSVVRIFANMMSTIPNFGNFTLQYCLYRGILYETIYSADRQTSPESATATFAEYTAVVTMDSDPAIASLKLQTDLLEILNWFKKWRMTANESKSTHVTFTTRRETCLPVHINNVQFPQEEYVKYLGLHLDRRLTWHKHIFAKRKQLGISLTKMYRLLGRKSKLCTGNELLIYKITLKPIWTYGI